MSWKIVQEFENKIADFYGSNFAVATDCCTHAIELCLRLTLPKKIITCPKHTYLSVPMTFIKLGLQWKFEKNNWEKYYNIANTNIIDAATLWKAKSYIKNSFMCISFQYKKPLNLGRGGVILCENKDDYLKLKAMSYDGRDMISNTPWSEQNISSIGYHYYMTPETADHGLKKMQDEIPEQHWSYKDYPDLSKLEVFTDGKN